MPPLNVGYLIKEKMLDVGIAINEHAVVAGGTPSKLTLLRHILGHIWHARILDKQGSQTYICTRQSNAYVQHHTQGDFCGLASFWRKIEPGSAIGRAVKFIRRKV